jgi:transmembrane sensor
MDKERISYLYQRHLDEVLTGAELAELKVLAKDPEFSEELEDLTENLWDYDEQGGAGIELAKARSFYEYIVLHPQQKRPHRIWLRIVAVAAAVAIVVSGIYFFNYSYHKTYTDMTAAVYDIAPGKVGATLTLANGKKIRLSGAQKGEIAKEAGISVTKTVDGQLVYEIKEANSASNKINTLSTAKGETYILTLPDKSKVWLNAASSLTYSARLNERGLRKVRLEGEAYFEIAKDKAHPFVVEAAGQSLEVLGTHFNVNAYADESGIKTTLLEGSVRVAGDVENVTLKPGQQSLVSGNRGIDVKEVDVNDVIAWKNGKFRFDDTSLEDVMKQFARWYNVDVVYLDGISNRKFTGGINRNITAAEALSLLQFSNVKFKIEGKKIIVTK